MAVRLLFFVCLLLLTAAAARAAEESSGKQLAGAGARIEDHAGSAGSPSDIARLVRQIGAADYAAREAATRELVAAGPQAIPLLAEAAAGDDLETAYRAVRVLQSFSDGDNRATQKRAVSVLEGLAANGNKTTAALAVDALTFYHLGLQDRAIEDLRRLAGGYSAVRPIGSEDPTLDPSGIKAVLDTRYTGKSSDMELLKQITNLQWLQIVNVPLDQEALAIIGQLPGLARVDLYGTGVSPQTVEALARKLPAGARIDRRDGALLGVKGSSGQLSCIVEEVQANSAASAAGLLDHDEITAFDGQPVRNFEELTALVSAKKGGEQVQLEIRRDSETLIKSVTLGRWK
jgi:hypothetical protein